MDDLPAPLTPADCNLTDFKFMPLEVSRLRRSKGWLMAKRDPALGFYMLNLWAVSWHEVPAGSLEDDDDVLADAAMCEPRRWAAIREKVLRGWIKCSDGRLYHPVVAEKANESFVKKQGYGTRLEKARETKRQKKAETENRPMNRNVTESVKGPMTDSIIDLETDHNNKGQGEGDKERAGLRPDAESVPASPEPRSIRQALWSDGVPILRKLIGKSDSQARQFLGKLLKSANDDCAKVYRVIREAEDLKPIDPASWLTKAVAPPVAKNGSGSLLAGLARFRPNARTVPEPEPPPGHPAFDLAPGEYTDV